MASITPSPTRGDTILHQLSSYGYEGDGALRACLAAGRFPVNAVNSERATPLHLAVRCAYFEGISLLLAYGADPNAADARGRRSLHFSALLPNFSAEAARALLDAGATAHVNDADGFAPLHIAAACGHAACVRELVLRGGAAVDAPERAAGQTPLHLAAEAGHTDTVRELLSLGASAAALCFRGLSPADVAAAKGWRAIAATLYNAAPAHLQYAPPPAPPYAPSTAHAYAAEHAYGMPPPAPLYGHRDAQAHSHARAFAPHIPQPPSTASFAPFPLSANARRWDVVGGGGVGGGGGFTEHSYDATRAALLAPAPLPTAPPQPPPHREKRNGPLPPSAPPQPPHGTSLRGSSPAYLSTQQHGSHSANEGMHSFRSAEDGNGTTDDEGFHTAGDMSEASPDVRSRAGGGASRGAPYTPPSAAAEISALRRELEKMRAENAVLRERVTSAEAGLADASFLEGRLARLRSVVGDAEERLARVRVRKDETEASPLTPREDTASSASPPMPPSSVAPASAIADASPIDSLENSFSGDATLNKSTEWNVSETPGFSVAAPAEVRRRGLVLNDSGVVIRTSNGDDAEEGAAPADNAPASAVPFKYSLPDNDTVGNGGGGSGLEPRTLAVWESFFHAAARGSGNANDQLEVSGGPSATIALAQAVCMRNLAAVDRLLLAGAPPNKLLFFPAGTAVEYPLLALEDGCAVVSMGTSAGLNITAMHAAAAVGDAGILAKLCESQMPGDDEASLGLDSRDEQGATPLLIAASCALSRAHNAEESGGFNDCVAYLLGSAADTVGVTVTGVGLRLIVDALTVLAAKGAVAAQVSLDVFRGYV